MLRSKWIIAIALSLSSSSPAFAAGAPDATAPALVTRLTALEGESQSLATSIVALRGSVSDAVAQRSRLEASIQASSRQIQQHLKAGGEAERRHEKAMKKRKPEAAPSKADLEQARAEYQAVLGKAKPLQQQLAEERALDQKLEGLASEARTLEARARTLASEGRTIPDRTRAALRALETRATSAGSEASLLRNRTGFALPGAFERTSAQTDEVIREVARTQALVAEGQKRVAALGARARPSAAPAKPAARGCDLRKLDWQGMTKLPGHGALTRSEQLTELQENVQEVHYGDLDGNGAEEAYVFVSGNYGANDGQTTLYGYDAGKNCALVLLGSADLPGGCSGPTQIQVMGRRLAVDVPVIADSSVKARCFAKSQQRKEYGLVGRKLTLVKSANVAEAARGSASADIAGIRLGMTLEQARAAIQTHDPAMKIVTSKAQDSLEGWQVGEPYLRQLVASVVYREEIIVSFARPPAEPRVIDVFRSHEDPRRATSHAVYRAALLEKYGRASDESFATPSAVPTLSLIWAYPSQSSYCTTGIGPSASYSRQVDANRNWLTGKKIAAEACADVVSIQLSGDPVFRAYSRLTNVGKLISNAEANAAQVRILKQRAQEEQRSRATAAPKL